MKLDRQIYRSLTVLLKTVDSVFTNENFGFRLQTEECDDAGVSEDAALLRSGRDAPAVLPLGGDRPPPPPPPGPPYALPPLRDSPRRDSPDSSGPPCGSDDALRRADQPRIGLLHDRKTKTAPTPSPNTDENAFKQICASTPSVDEKDSAG